MMNFTVCGNRTSSVIWTFKKLINRNVISKQRLKLIGRRKKEEGRFKKTFVKEFNGLLKARSLKDGDYEDMTEWRRKISFLQN